MNTAIKKTALLTGAVAVVLVAIWYMTFFSPQSHKLTAAHNAYTAAQSQVLSLDQQIVQLEALKKEIPADELKLKALEQAIPDNPDLADALGQLHTVATSTGVTLSNLGPSLNTGSGSSSSASSSTPSINLSMTASGTYPSLMNFLTALDGMPRTVIVTSVSLSSGTGGLTASLAAQIFYANSASTNNGSSGNPAASAAPAK